VGPGNSAGPKSTITRTASVEAESTGAPPEIQSAAAKTPSTTLTVLIAIAASIGGVVIIWTIFRKWKLGRSAKFDERLQPIDWQPTNADDSGVPGIRRVASNASSFQSASSHNLAGRGYGASDHGHGSDHSHGPAGLAPLPDHDFTAGAALAPVGGYADLARGQSPSPPMHELSRGPSVNRPAYDVGVPLHHQAGYGQQDDNYNGRY